ncbi:MAG: sensor histidine kinase, partial [Candidatus Shapirobacteria bacterium]|nr:sensor histidine kinase [Candidatus Shapirobacteria bacterium]
LAQYQKPNGLMKFDSISLEDIVTKAIQKIGPIAQTKQISFVNRTKNTKFQGNLTNLVDLLVVLLDNAVKYSPAKSKITLVSKNFKNSLSLSVLDRGIGITATDLPHIFDRFYRADTARADSDINGYGLGLSIAKKIADSHHGSISVDSIIGQGSTFTVRLPLTQFS